MEVFWQLTRKGQRMVLRMDDQEEMIGGIRQTKRGVDAFAKTFSMTPERAQKGFASIEEAKAFVESFRPWELFLGPVSVTVDPELKPEEA